ncbi:MAG: transmembrane anchor protein [Candidatus Eisenbacteria bacterium]
MPKPNAAVKSDLPSSRTLIRSTIIAAAVSAVLLVTVVLPAEYGVDPTGMGGVLGLTQMGKIKSALAREEAAHQAAAKTSPPIAPPTAPGAEFGPQAALPDSAGRTDVTRLTLRPNEGREIKLVMRMGKRAGYSWSAEGGLVNFDTHAEPFNAPSGAYHSYEKGNGVKSDEGTLIAAFDGQHGWYWRNVGSEEVTVTLKTRGEYEEVRVLE